MSTDDTSQRVIELVASCLEQMDQGVESPDYDLICGGDAELIERVRAGVERAVEFPTIQSRGRSEDPRLGTRVSGRYRIERRLGAGAMGIVYEAEDLELGRTVAVKVVHLGFMDREQALARFEREAAALAAVRHPSVVTVHDRGVTDDGSPFLVMERIDGVPCSAILAHAESRKNRDGSAWLTEEIGIEGVVETSFVREVTRWAAEVAEGLQSAHDVGVFHRDVKPSNVMIRRDGRPVLIDFGIAAQENQETLTDTGASVGTPAYMPPEALFGRVTPSPAQDVYGLTATLYHLVTLSAPYEGTPSKILTALATRDPVPAVRLRPGLPRDIQAILDNGFVRNPAGRYGSLSVVAQDLRAVLALRPVSVRPTSSIVRTARRLRSSKAVWTAAAFLVALGLFVGIREYRRYVTEARYAAFSTVWPSVPANLGLVAPVRRVVASEDARAAIEDTLDQVVASHHDYSAALYLRATFAWDQGDRARACVDMDRLASEVGTPFAKGLAAEFRAKRDTAERVSTDSLPAPGSRADHDLLLYSLMRGNRWADAVALAEDEAKFESRHAEELRLLLRVLPLRKKTLPQSELGPMAQRLVADVREYEGSTQLRSAITAHLRSVSNGRMRLHERALSGANEVLAQAPLSFVALENAAKLAFDLQRFSEAGEYAGRALELVPTASAMRSIRVRVHAEIGLYDEALRIADTEPESTGAKGRNTMDAARMIVRLIEANALFANEPSLAKVPAERALSDARSLLGHREHGEVAARVERFAVLMLDSSTTSPLFSAYLDDLAEMPTSSWRLRNVVAGWPDDLGEADTTRLLTWIEALKRELDVRREAAAEQRIASEPPR